MWRIIPGKIPRVTISCLLCGTLALLVWVKLGYVTLPGNGRKSFSVQLQNRKENQDKLYRGDDSPENSPSNNSNTPIEESNEDRKQRIQKLCQASSDPPPSTRQRMHDYFIYYTLVDDHHKILYCTISKASSTTMKYTLLNLKNKTLSEQEAKLVHDVGLLEKNGLKYLDRFSETEVNYRLDNYYKFLITRDPFERLFSTHRDKFLQPDEKCYQKIAGDEIKEAVRSKNASKEPDVQFGEFVRYVALNAEDAVIFDRHWVPQFYVCDPCNVQYDYVAKVDTLSGDLRNIFKEVGIPWNKLPHHNSHGNHKTPIANRYSGIEPSDLQKLYQIYDIDMEAFGYRAPWNQGKNGAETHSENQFSFPAARNKKIRYFVC